MDVETSPAQLAERIAELDERVAALEAVGRPSGRPGPDRGLGLVRSVIDVLPTGEDGTPTAGALVYAGAGPGPDGLTAFQMEHGWDEVLDADPAPLAQSLAAMGNPVRLHILRMLLRGPVSTADLTEALDAPSSGQLFHHLKELLAAGLIHQPSRGSYATRTQHVVPVLVALSCASDLAVPMAQVDR